MPVAIPVATAAVMAHAHIREVLWGLLQLAALLLPLLLLFTGWSARIRTACAWLARGNRYATLLGVTAVYLVLGFLVSVPLFYWRDGAFQALAPEAVRTAILLVPAALFLWIPFALIRSSPRRWWIYSALALIPVAFAVLVALPVFVDPLFTSYKPLDNPKLAREIETLAARCGVGPIPIFVGGDDDTVVGLGPTNRIVLETGIEKVETPDQITGTVSHELKHYVMGDNYKALAIIAALLFAGFGLVHMLGRAAIRRWHRRFGFDQLSDPAALPLIVLILTAFWLAVLPAFNAFARSIEREADRFGLELTHTGPANAALYAGWVKDSPADYDTFFRVFRATHPSIAERIAFANAYRPWETGVPLVYGDICRPMR